MTSQEPDKLSVAIDEAVDLLGKFVIPLYQDDLRVRPSQVGSGFIVHAENTHVFVSAAHVLESVSSKALYFYVGGNKTRALSGTLFRGRPANDLIDIGGVRLDPEALPPYPEVEKFAVDVAYLHPTLLPREQKHYLIVGTPASQSRTNPLAQTVTTRMYAYHHESAPVEAYVAAGYAPATHVLIPLDLKVGYDSDGVHRNFPRPQGMSGSPIWVLYDEDFEDETRTFPIVAVATTYLKNERLLVGTDSSAVLDLVNAAV